MAFNSILDTKTSALKENGDERSTLKRSLPIDVDPLAINLSQDQLAGLPMAKRPAQSGYGLGINGGLAAHQALNMNYAMGLLPNSSSVAQQSCVSPIMANAATTNGIINSTAALTGNSNAAQRMAFPQGFHYQLAAMQAQAKAQQIRPSNHAQLFQQMQAAQEQSSLLARAQAEAQAQAQARAHVEAQARAHAHVQAQARAKAQAEANQAQALQQQAAALAQQRSMMASGVTTAHEYYYAHAQRAAASLPEYLARLAAQQSQGVTSSASKVQPKIFQPSNEQFLLHQQQQQLYQNSLALQQSHQQQQLQLAVAAASVQQQQKTEPTNFAMTQRPLMISTSQPTPQSPRQTQVFTPATSTTNGVMPNQLKQRANNMMGPHEDQRYYEFINSVMQLERQIAEKFASSANFSLDKIITSNDNTTTQHSQQLDVNTVDKNVND